MGMLIVIAILVFITLIVIGCVHAGWEKAKGVHNLANLDKLIEGKNNK